jgi:hypothetical protein
MRQTAARSTGLTALRHAAAGAVIPASGHNIALANPAALAPACFAFFAVR